MNNTLHIYIFGGFQEKVNSSFFYCVAKIHYKHLFFVWKKNYVQVFFFPECCDEQTTYIFIILRSRKKKRMFQLFFWCVLWKIHNISIFSGSRKKKSIFHLFFLIWKNYTTYIFFRPQEKKSMLNFFFFPVYVEINKLHIYFF